MQSDTFGPVGVQRWDDFYVSAVLTTFSSKLQNLEILAGKGKAV